MSKAIKHRWFCRRKNDLGNTPIHLRGKKGETFLTERQAQTALKSEAIKLNVRPKELEGPFQFTAPAPAK